MSSAAITKAKMNAKKKPVRPSKDVRIMVKLNWSGRRIGLVIPVDALCTTLDTVLNLVAAQENDTPIPTILSSCSYEDATLLYLRTCISKAQWHTTTLHQLGIENGGSALLTLNLVTNSNDNFHENAVTLAATSAATTITTPLPEKPLASSTASTTTIVKEMPKNNNLIIVASDNIDSIANNNESSASLSMPMEIDTTPPTEPTRLTPITAIQRLLSSNFDVDSKECGITLLKIVNNLLSRPNDAKYRTINITNIAFHHKVATKTGGLHFLNAIGFTLRCDLTGKHMVLPSHNDSQITLLLEARRVLFEALTDLGVSTQELPKITATTAALPWTATTDVRPPPPLPEFDVYRGQMFSIAAAYAGADPTTVAPDGNAYVSKIDRELHSLIAKTKQLEEEVASKKLDRGIVALLPVQTISTTSDESVLVAAVGVDDNEGSSSVKGDGFLLSARVKRMIEDTQKRETGGFTTKAMRDLDKVKQTKIYSFTKLRICFPDGCSVSAKFYPSETVAIVKEVLVNEVLMTECDFDFYAPPRRALTLSKTLAEEQCCPAAKIYVSWKDPPPTTNTIQARFFVTKVPDEEFPESKGILDIPKNEKTSTANENDRMNKMMGKSIGLSKSSNPNDKDNQEKKKKPPAWFKR